MNKNDDEMSDTKEKFPTWICIGTPLTAGLINGTFSMILLHLEDYKPALLFMMFSVMLIAVSITGVMTKRIVESNGK